MGTEQGHGPGQRVEGRGVDELQADQAGALGTAAPDAPPGEPGPPVAEGADASPEVESHDARSERELGEIADQMRPYEDLEQDRGARVEALAMLYFEAELVALEVYDGAEGIHSASTWSELPEATRECRLAIMRELLETIERHAAKGG